MTQAKSNKNPMLANSKLANILLWCVYAAIVCFTAAHHEPWRDEADSWLCTRDESLSTILSRTGYMGTPILWYAVVFPLSKLGLPYGAMESLNVIFALLSVGLIIFRSPFGFWLKATMCLSYLFTYEYSIIARSYGLSVLLIMCLAALYHKRLAHPLYFGVLIALLANTNVHGLIVAIAVSAAVLFTNFRNSKFAQWLPTLLIAGVGVCASILQLIPPPDGQLPGVLSSEWYKQPVLSTFRGAFFPDLALSISRGYGQASINEKIGLVFKLLSFGLIALILKKIWSNKFAVFTFVLSYGALFSLFAFKYYGSIRHWGFYVLVAIFCLWIQAEESESVGKAVAADGSAVPVSRSLWNASLSKKLDLACIVGLILSFVYASVVGLYACAIDIKKPFSYSEEVAKQLKLLNAADAPVVCAPNYALSALPFLPGKQFFYPNINQFGTHALWNGAEKRDLTAEQVCEIVNQRFGTKEKLFLVTDKESPVLVEQGFKRVYGNESAPISVSENFVIYERN
ncbi:MAG: hypothetical protein JST89_16965 [Cyanobacteria bacterium SZAS-4]|nr:hypothetical protein [Cyanobacteria bacterium SZAS-4]